MITHAAKLKLSSIQSLLLDCFFHKDTCVKVREKICPFKSNSNKQLVVQDNADSIKDR